MSKQSTFDRAMRQIVAVRLGRRKSDRRIAKRFTNVMCALIRHSTTRVPESMTAKGRSQTLRIAMRTMNNAA